ncbi:MAG TPA: VTT domain-containing protein [Acidobacteriota bacterium]|nr:VTT domain-containing protein [Acidobacteriota bacterium]
MLLALGILDGLKAAFRWLTEFAMGLGGPGLFLLAMADSSFLSVPEGNDILIVVKSAGESWTTMTGFVLWTIAGSTIGCCMLYSVGRWGGTWVSKRLDPKKVERIGRLYSRRGVFTIIIPAILPPPTPFKVFVLSAGIFRLPLLTFIIAVVIGRSIRYFMWGILAVLYGLAVRDWIIANAKTVGIFALIGFLILMVVLFWRVRRRRPPQGGEGDGTGVPKTNLQKADSQEGVSEGGSRKGGKSGVGRTVTGTAMLVLMLTGVGCGPVKDRTKIVIPDAHRNAQSASLDDLVQLHNQRWADYSNMTVSSLQVEFTGASIEGGVIEEDRYRRAKAVLIAERPEKVYLNIKNPIGGASLAAMASQEGHFQIYVPREKRFFIGSTDVVLEEERDDSRLSVRPHHLVHGLLVERIPFGEEGYFVTIKQDQDSRFKYYVISVIRLAPGGASGQLLREVWFERSEMRLIRQNYYTPEGALESSILYGDPVEVDDRMISSVVDIARPLENYSMQFELDPQSIRINRQLQEGTFVVRQPAGVELIDLDKEAQSVETARAVRDNP